MPEQPRRTSHSSTLPFVIGLLSVAVATADASNSEQLVDRVAAFVNTEPVLWSDIRKKEQKEPIVKFSSFPAPEDSSNFVRALHDAINRQLVLIETEALGISVSDAEVDEHINNLLARGSNTMEQLKVYLDDKGLSLADYRGDIRDMMLFMRFRGRVILPQIKITDADVEEYYLRHFGTAKSAIKLELRRILFRREDDPLIDQKKRELAAEVYKKLQGGYRFDELATTFSDDASSFEQDESADSYFLKDLSQDIRKELDKLKAGEFSKPIETSLGWIIFFVDKRSNASSAEFLANKEKAEEQLRRREILRKTDQWFERKRQTVQIKILPN